MAIKAILNSILLFITILPIKLLFSIPQALTPTIRDYEWTNNDNIDDLFIPENNYVISDPLSTQLCLLLKEYNILDDNEEDLIVLAHKDHPFHHFEINAEQLWNILLLLTPNVNSNSLLKLIDKWDLHN